MGHTLRGEHAWKEQGKGKKALNVVYVLAVEE
jgi:hypothetical protein